LCGMSADYYSRIEQQRGSRPSEPMLAAIARGLHLSLDERDHLFRLAGHPTPARGLRLEHVDAGLIACSTGCRTPRPRSSPASARPCCRPRRPSLCSATRPPSPALAAASARELIDRSAATQDRDLARRLWTVSKQLTGTRSPLQPVPHLS
jgi:Helix-turn-helix domain